jgi:hypothetical protein
MFKFPLSFVGALGLVLLLQHKADAQWSVTIVTNLSIAERNENAQQVSYDNVIVYTDSTIPPTSYGFVELYIYNNSADEYQFVSSKAIYPGALEHTFSMRNDPNGAIGEQEGVIEFNFQSLQSEYDCIVKLWSVFPLQELKDTDQDVLTTDDD